MPLGEPQPRTELACLLGRRLQQSWQQPWRRRLSRPARQRLLRGCLRLGAQQVQRTQGGPLRLGNTPMRRNRTDSLPVNV